MNRHIFLFDLLLDGEFVIYLFFSGVFKEIHYKEKFNNFDKLLIIN